MKSTAVCPAYPVSPSSKNFNFEEDQLCKRYLKTKEIPNKGFNWPAG